MRFRPMIYPKYFTGNRDKNTEEQGQSAADGKVKSPPKRLPALAIPGADSDEIREYMAQKLQDRVLKFRTRLSPRRLLRIVNMAIEVSTEVQDHSFCLNRVFFGLLEGEG